MPENTGPTNQRSAPLRFKPFRLRIADIERAGCVCLRRLIGFTTRGVHIKIPSRQPTAKSRRNVATALAEQSAWTFQGIDLLLRDTARWYQNDSKKIAPERLDEVLADRTMGARQIHLITITDAQGIQRHRSVGSSPPDLDVSDRSYFNAQRERSTGLFMSEPLVTRSEKRAGIVLSRRLEDETGAFAGVVAAVVNLEDLEKFYSAVNLGNGSAVHLLRDNGQLLVRDPPQPGSIGKTLPRLAIALKAPSSGFTDPIDGKQEFIAVAGVRDTPLVVAVTREKAVALQPWRDEAMRLAARTAVVALLGLIGIGMLSRQLRRIEQAQSDREQLEAAAAIRRRWRRWAPWRAGSLTISSNMLGAIWSLR